MFLLSEMPTIKEKEVPSQKEFLQEFSFHFEFEFLNKYLERNVDKHLNAIMQFLTKKSIGKMLNGNQSSR